MEHWPRPYTLEDESDLDSGGHARGQAGAGAGNEYFSVPGHTPVIFSEVGGRTLYRLLARDAGGETEGVLLNETVPAWVVDIVVEKKLPKFIKVRTSFIGEDNNSSDNQFISTGHVLRPASSHVGLQNLQEGETNSQ